LVARPAQRNVVVEANLELDGVHCDPLGQKNLEALKKFSPI